MFWTIIICLGAAWIVQSILSFRQMQTFSKEFVDMRKQGRVSLGKFQGGVVSGAIVMFSLDDEGRIRYGKRLHGVTVAARFREYPTFDGQLIAEIDPNMAKFDGRGVVKAVRNAKENYIAVTAGRDAIEPSTPLGRVFSAPGKLGRNLWRGRAGAGSQTEPAAQPNAAVPAVRHVVPAAPSKMRRKVAAPSK